MRLLDWKLLLTTAPGRHQASHTSVCVTPQQTQKFQSCIACRACNGHADHAVCRFVFAWSGKGLGLGYRLHLFARKEYLCIERINMFLLELPGPVKRK